VGKNFFAADIIENFGSKGIQKIVIFKNLKSSKDDEDITALDTLLVTNSMPSSLEGPMIRSHACRLNFEVRSFLMLQPNIHEDGMLLNFWDVLLLRNMESTNTPASNSAQSDNNYMHKTEFT
jgi:hypothetical protein